MVVDIVYDFMETDVFMVLTGLVLLIAGYQGVVSPDGWALAMGMAGQLFNVLPNVVHQILGGLIGFAGLSQVASVADNYL